MASVSRSRSRQACHASLPPEDLHSMTKNAGEIHGKHAAGNDNPSPQRSPNIGVEFNPHNINQVSFERLSVVKAYPSSTLTVRLSNAF